MGMWQAHRQLLAAAAGRHPCIQSNSAAAHAVPHPATRPCHPQPTCTMLPCCIFKYLYTTADGRLMGLYCGSTGCGVSTGSRCCLAAAGDGPAFGRQCCLGQCCSLLWGRMCGHKTPLAGLEGPPAYRTSRLPWPTPGAVGFPVPHPMLAAPTALLELKPRKI